MTGRTTIVAGLFVCALAQPACLADPAELGEEHQNVAQYWIAQDSSGTAKVYAQLVDSNTLGVTSTSGMQIIGDASDPNVTNPPPRMGVAGFKRIPGTSNYMAIVGSTDDHEAQFAVVGDGWRWDGAEPPDHLYSNFQFWAQQDASGSAEVFKKLVDAATFAETGTATMTKIASAGDPGITNPSPVMGVSAFKLIPATYDYLAVVGSTDAHEAQFIRIGIGSGGWIFAAPRTSDARADLLTEARLLQALDLGAATHMSMMVSYALSLGLSQDQVVEYLLEVLVGVSRNDLNAGFFVKCIFACPAHSPYFVGQGIADGYDLLCDFDDGTDNQVFHTYFYVGMAYFHGWGLAKAANDLHESQHGGTVSDRRAAEAGMILGGALREGKSLKQVVDEQGFTQLAPNYSDLDALYTTPVTLSNLDQVTQYAVRKPAVRTCL